MLKTPLYLALRNLSKKTLFDVEILNDTKKDDFLGLCLFQKEN